MANSDKNVVITPNISSSSDDPKIVFSGADSSTGPQNITIKAYPSNSGTLSFEGSNGQLFSVTNSLTGVIFSANDASGIPSLELMDNGLFKINPYGAGRTVIGANADNGIDRLQVNGGITTTTYLKSIVSTGTAPLQVNSTTLVANLNADMVDGLNIHTGTNNEANRLVRTDGSGYIQAGYIQSSAGNENNASNPPRVWGTNGSDSYFRTYQVGSLSVGTATNWGSYGAVPGAGTSFGNANTIGRSDGNGYTYFNYINSNTGNSENPTVGQVIVTNTSDNFYRKASIAHVTSAVQSNASGTWNISISGNAATATSASSATTADQIDSIGFRNTNQSAINADTLESNGITYYTSGVTNFSGNSTDGALYSQVYSSSWQHQIAGDYRSGQIAVRGKNSGTWQSWKIIATNARVFAQNLILG